MLSAAMQAALIANPGSQLVSLLALSLPADAGGTMRISDGPVSVVGEGHYEQRVTSWSRIKFEISDRGGNLQGVSTTVEMTDLDGPDRSIGPFGRASKLAKIQNSAAVIRFAMEGVAPADFSTQFTGVLDRWERSGETSWRLSLRSNDAPLREPAPRVKLTAADWPGAFRPTSEGDGNGAVIGRYAPVVMGRVDSLGLGNNGLRRTYLVDTARNRYLVSLGEIGATGFRVFKDGAELVSGWTRLHVTIGGRRWTVVDFTATQGTSVITVDCQGIDLGSYGTYTNPVNQLRFFLENLAFREWNGFPSAIAAASFTDSASFSGTTTSLTAYEGAPVMGGEATTGSEWLRQWCVSNSAYCFWTPLGTIGVGIWKTVLASGIYGSAAASIAEQPYNLGELGIDNSSDDQVDAIDMAYLLGPDGAPQQNLSVYHPRRLTAQAADRKNTWGPGRVL